MVKIKEIGLKCLTLFLLFVGVLFVFLTQLMIVTGAIFHRWAKDVLVKFSYDNLDSCWNRMIDDAYDAINCLLDFFLTAKV